MLPHLTPRIDRHNSKNFSKTLRSEIYTTAHHNNATNNINEKVMKEKVVAKEKMIENRIPLSNRTNIEKIEKIQIQAESWKLQKQLYKNKHNKNEPIIEIFTNNKPVDYINEEENMKSFEGEIENTEINENVEANKSTDKTTDKNTPINNTPDDIMFEDGAISQISLFDIDKSSSLNNNLDKSLKKSPFKSQSTPIVNIKLNKWNSENFKSFAQCDATPINSSRLSTMGLGNLSSMMNNADNKNFTDPVIQSRVLTLENDRDSILIDLNLLKESHNAVANVASEAATTVISIQSALLQQGSCIDSQHENTSNIQSQVTSLESKLSYLNDLLMKLQSESDNLKTKFNNFEVTSYKSEPSFHLDDNKFEADILSIKERINNMDSVLGNFQLMTNGLQAEAQNFTVLKNADASTIKAFAVEMGNFKSELVSIAAKHESNHKECVKVHKIQATENLVMDSRVTSLENKFATFLDKKEFVEGSVTKFETKLEKFTSSLTNEFNALKSSTESNVMKLSEQVCDISSISKRVQTLEINQKNNAVQVVGKSNYEADLKQLKNELNTNLNNQVNNLRFVKPEDIKTMVEPIIEQYLKEFLEEYTAPIFQFAKSIDQKVENVNSFLDTNFAARAEVEKMIQNSISKHVSENSAQNWKSPELLQEFITQEMSVQTSLMKHEIEIKMKGLFQSFRKDIQTDAVTSILNNKNVYSTKIDSSMKPSKTEFIPKPIKNEITLPVKALELLSVSVKNHVPTPLVSSMFVPSISSKHIFTPTVNGVAAPPNSGLLAKNHSLDSSVLLEKLNILNKFQTPMKADVSSSPIRNEPIQTPKKVEKVDAACSPFKNDELLERINDLSCQLEDSNSQKIELSKRLSDFQNRLTNQESLIEKFRKEQEQKEKLMKQESEQRTANVREILKEISAKQLCIVDFIDSSVCKF